MYAAFYRPDSERFLMCPLIKKQGRVFVSKHTAAPFLPIEKKIMNMMKSCSYTNEIGPRRHVPFCYSIMFTKSLSLPNHNVKVCDK